MASCGGYQNQAVGRSKRKRETATSTSLDGVCWGEAFPPAKFKKENTPKTFEITALYRVAHFPVSSCPVRISSLNFLGRLQTDSGNNKQTSERANKTGGQCVVELWWWAGKYGGQALSAKYIGKKNTLEWGWWSAISVRTKQPRPTNDDTDERRLSRDRWRKEGKSRVNLNRALHSKQWTCGAVVERAIVPSATCASRASFDNDDLWIRSWILQSAALCAELSRRLLSVPGATSPPHSTRFIGGN